MARFYKVYCGNLSFLIDIDEIQGFQAGRDRIRIIMKHEFYGLWCEKNEVLTIMGVLGIPQVEIDAFVNC